MRLTWIASAVLLLSAVSSNAAGPKSNAAAVSMFARVAPVLRLQADVPSATGATASVISTGQNAFTVQFTTNVGEATLIEIPIVMRSNLNDVLLKASIDGAESGYIRMDAGEEIASSILSRPMPIGPNVTFAMASGLLRASAVGAPLSGRIVIALPPGAVPEGKRASLQITLQALRQ